MELWDAYDGAFRKIGGVSLVRGEPVPAGLYHIVCEIIVRHADGTWLLMRRDSRKRHGNMWEASAGGSALRGETLLDCAVRELREETGLSGVMKQLGTIRTKNTFYGEFLCETDCDKDAIVLQAGETIGYRWATAAEIAALTAEELASHRIQAYFPELQRK